MWGFVYTKKRRTINLVYCFLCYRVDPFMEYKAFSYHKCVPYNKDVYLKWTEIENYIEYIKYDLS